MLVQAFLRVEQMHGLQAVCLIKEIPFQLRQRGLILGPCDIEVLLPALLVWHRLHPTEAQESSVLILDSQDSASAPNPATGISWRGISLAGGWSNLLLQTSDGAVAWDLLEARHQARRAPEMPIVWFGRDSETALLRRRLESSPVIVLEGQPLIGRSTFAHAFASTAFHDWVEGAERLDLNQKDVSESILVDKIASKWSREHKLFILDHASAAASWLNPVLKLLSEERTLCSLLVIPSEDFLDPEFPRVTLGPLDHESFEKLWTLHFGESSQDHLDRMNERTGRAPGVVTAVHRQLGRRSPTEIEAAFDHNYSRQMPLLLELGRRVGGLTRKASRRLRILSLASAQISLRLALEPMGEDTASLHEVGELLTSGWMMVEEEGYRIPRPYALAARAALQPDTRDLLHACEAFVARARSLSDLERDLMPLENSRAFLHLLWTSWEAMSWLVTQDEHLDLALEAAVLLWLPALTHGYSAEFLSTTHLLAQRLQQLPPNRLTPIFWEGRGRHYRAQGDLRASLACFELGVSQARKLGLVHAELWNLHFKAATLSVMGDTKGADSLFQDLLQRRRESESARELAHALSALALHCFRNGRTESLSSLLIEANSLAVIAKAKEVLVVTKELQGWLRLRERDLTRAEELFAEAELLGQTSSRFRRDQVGLGRAVTAWNSGRREEALNMISTMEERSSDLEMIPLMLLRLNGARMLLMMGETEKGAAAARTCCEMMSAMKAMVWMGEVLDLASLAAWKTGHPSSAAILSGSSFHWQTKFGWGSSWIQEEANSWRSECREHLGTDAFQARYQAGAGLEPFRLIELCRVDCSLVSQLLPELMGGRAVSKPIVSERQMDVLRLASQGMSNRQIAEALFLEEGTVKRHLHNLSNELGAAGRVRLVKKARDLGLLP